jgi:phosphatidylethanolamine/phosphatidyl-N-methylethanolamine N-methyltransferase
VKIEAIDLAYRRYARGYDVYFGNILQPGRRAAIERMDCRPGDTILEVGVGTGLSLPLYPPQTRVCGIDICHEMLARAKARVAREQLRQAAGLFRMDAERMGFADDSFDKVVAMYVVSVAPDPARLVDEMRRVCKPQGELFIVNHFLHSNPVVSVMEQLAAPLSRFLGFNPNLSLHDFIRQARVEVRESLPVNAFGYWTLLRARNNKQAGGQHGC